MARRTSSSRASRARASSVAQRLRTRGVARKSSPGTTAPIWPASFPSSRKSTFSRAPRHDDRLRRRVASTAELVFGCLHAPQRCARLGMGVHPNPHRVGGDARQRGRGPRLVDGGPWRAHASVHRLRRRKLLPDPGRRGLSLLVALDLLLESDGGVDEEHHCLALLIGCQMPSLLFLWRWARRGARGRSEWPSTRRWAARGPRGAQKPSVSPFDLCHRRGKVPAG